MILGTVEIVEKDGRISVCMPAEEWQRIKYESPGSEFEAFFDVYEACKANETAKCHPRTKVKNQSRHETASESSRPR